MTYPYVPRTIYMCYDEGWEANQRLHQRLQPKEILRFPIPPGKHFSNERGLPFYYLKIGFLEYLRISGEIRYPNGPIG